MNFAAVQVVRSLRRHLPRHLPAVLALGMAAASVCAIGSLSSDVARKMTSEYRREGANAVARDARASSLEPAAAARLTTDRAVVQSLPVVVLAASVNKAPVVAIVLDFSAARPFSRGWDVEGRLPESAAEAAIGRRLAEREDLRAGSQFKVAFPDGERNFKVSAIVSSGEGEDDEILLPASAFGGRNIDRPAAVLLRLAGSGSAVLAEAREIERTTGLRVDPILAVASSEGRVLSKLSWLLTTVGAAVALLAAVATATTLLASVIRRRRELGLQMSLGADGRRLTVQFMAEAVSLGVAGGLLGAAVGLLAANALERRLFAVSLTVSPVWPALGLIFAVVLAAGASLPAMDRLRRTEAIVALRDE